MTDDTDQSLKLQPPRGDLDNIPPRPRRRIAITIDPVHVRELRPAEARDDAGISPLPWVRWKEKSAP